MDRLKIFGVLFLMFSGVFVNAQDNIIKADLTGALIGNITVGFERKVSENSSFQFKIGYIDPAISPVIPEKAFTPRAYTLLEAYGGINSSLEYRFYLSKKKGLQGFYIAPYIRYNNQHLLFDDEIENYIFSVDTRLSTIGIGGQMGYQWIFNEIFTLDFFFFGTGLDFHKAVIKYELDPEPPGFNYSMVTPHVEDVFEDIDYLKKKLTHKISDDNHTSDLPFLFPGLRMGLSIGVAF